MWCWLFGTSAILVIVYLICLSVAPGAARVLKTLPVAISGFICSAATLLLLRGKIPALNWPLCVAGATAATLGFTFYTLGDSLLAASPGDGWSGLFIAGAATFAVGHILLISSSALQFYARGGLRRRLGLEDAIFFAFVVVLAVSSAVTMATLLAIPSVCSGGGVTECILALFYLLLFAAMVVAFYLCGDSDGVTAATVAGALFILLSDIMLLAAGDMCGHMDPVPREYGVMLLYWTGFLLVAVGPYSTYARWAGWR